MVKTTYSHISENKKKTILIIVLFPLLLSALIFVALLIFSFILADPSKGQSAIGIAIEMSEDLIPLVLISSLVWVVVSVFIGGKMILKSASANELQKSDNPELYRIVENLSITAGLPMPKIYMINDQSMNAFTTGKDPKNASICFTTGLVANLNKEELEGVAAHEMSHIGNRDIRLMLIMIAGIGFCTFMGYMLLRMSARASRKGGKDSDKSALALLFLGITFLVFGYLVAPLLRLAVSRKREFQADATAALITRNPHGLASALQKISGHSQVAVIDKNANISAMCIANPLSSKTSKGFFSKFSGLAATHPSIEDRIKALNEMDGLAPEPKAKKTKAA